MAQPSQIEKPTRVVAGRVSAGQFLSLNQELADRGIGRSALVADLVITWLNAVTGRGSQCHCTDCPGNMRTTRRRFAATESMSMFEDMTA